ncbi:replication initiator protein A [Haloferula chungangensis]|uniref:Replication initiator protein A n=1 Tax=Haloferula chungangensis TaxID=1048331 RepID=A0ABW2LDW3_9BACT
MNSEENQSDELQEGQLNLFPGYLAFSAGKDELNFAEFPIAALANRINPDIKTITYEDEIRDSKTGKLVERKLQITGSDLYGLPTSADDEVILALINLSRLQGFSSRTVAFNRHQIISMLGWKNAAHYYKRIKESINRWLGVSLYYDNAWREKGKQSWGSEAFHLIDNIAWAENGEMSEITWNKRIFESFESGNLKALDLQTYRDLKSPTARRIYRFLDKRFGLGQSQWSFDLEKFAYNKIGLGRDSYSDMAQVKRQLAGAIKQLEEVNFIMPCNPKQRFTKVSRGVWKVHFERYRHQIQDPLPIVIDEETECESKLVGLGMGRTIARKLLAEYGEVHVGERIEWFEYREHKRQNGGIRSIPGYLVKSIKDGEFAAPDGFVSRAEKLAKAARAEKNKAEKANAEAKKRKEEAELQAQEEREIAAAMAIFEAFPAELQVEIEDVATDGFTQSGEEIRRMLIAAEIEKRQTDGSLD